MVLIKIHAKNEQIKREVLDWMIERLYTNFEISMYDLLLQHVDRVTVEDADILSHWDVGWNINDLLKLNKARHDLQSLEIPGPKCYFWAHYT